MTNQTAEAQLYKAWRGSGLTLEQLLDKLKKSGLDMSLVSLSRKIRGKQVLTTEECGVFADCLNVQVKIGRRRKAA